MEKCPNFNTRLFISFEMCWCKHAGFLSHKYDNQLPDSSYRLINLTKWNTELNKLCRECVNRLFNTGGKSYKNRCKRQYLTSRFLKEIIIVFSINVVNDSKENLCRNDMIRFSKSASEATIVKYSKPADLSAHLWLGKILSIKKKQSECLSCNHFKETTYFWTPKNGPINETSSSTSTSTEDTSSISTTEPPSVTSTLDPCLP